MPVLIPTEEVGVFAEALRKLIFAEAVKNVGIGKVGLPDKFRRRIVVFLFAPMDRDLRFAGLDDRLFL